jgi:subtilisin family serine protease
MKARVTKHLNVRTGGPIILPNNNPDFYSPGDTVEIIDTVVGDDYKGNNVWYKLVDGTFVWSGGVRRGSDSLLRVLSTRTTRAIQFDFANLIKFSGGKLLTSQGVGGVVAVLDSGVTHKSLQEQIILSKDFVRNGPSATDFFGHGTKVAGIIAGKGPVIKSMSPQCSLINFRVADQNGIVTSDPVFFALEALDKLQSPIDVINMSLDITSDLIPHIQPIIDRLLKKGTVTVVAAGNDNSVNTIALLQNTVRVGALNKDEFNNIRKQGLNKVFHCSFIDTPIVSTSLNDRHDQISQVSAYTALASSYICSFLKQPENLQLTGEERLPAVLKFLSDSSFSIHDQLSPEDFKPLKP